MAHVLKGGRLRTALPESVQSSPLMAPSIAGARPAASPQLSPAASTPPAQEQQTLSQAEDLDGLRRQAQADGFEAGRREAQQQIELALSRQEALLRQAIDAMAANLKERMSELEQFAVAVAYEACARVLTDAAIDERGIVSTVQRLLEHGRETALLRVQLPPAYVDLLTRSLAADPHWQHRAIRVEADPMLRAGECRVVGAHGQLESSLAVQLDTVRESLLATFAERAR